MNAKKYFITALGVGTVMLTIAASVWQAKREGNRSGSPALTGASGRFGPTVEIVLPAAKGDGVVEIADLETGCTWQQPAPDQFKAGACAIMDWVRSSGLDISGFAWSGGAACITYGMNCVPVAGRRWEQITEEELLNNPALAPGRHFPRRLLLQGGDHPDTYLFRTGEGALGMLRIAGLGDRGRGVRICYKLINPDGEIPVVSATKSRAKRDL